MSRCTKKNCPMVGVSADCDLKDCPYRTEADQSKGEDLIKRSDATEVIYKALRTPPLKGVLTDTMSLAVALVREIPSADRPQGEWIDKGKNLWKCSNCGMVIYSESEQDRNEFHKWCGRCGCAMKGADDE